MPVGVNPILPGFHPDPCILRVGEDYYMATSTFQWFGGVQLYHSRDLVHWEQLPSPLDRASQLDMRGAPNSGGVWAPCLSWCDGVFYLIYTNVKNFHGIFKDTPNYLVTATDVRGPWSEPVFLNSSGFDPSLFHDDDGRKYLINMRWDHRMENHAFESIVLQEYSPAEKRLIGEPVSIYRGTEIGATEAPHLFKRNGYYYLITAEGGTLYWHGVRLARSRCLCGPYEADPQPLLTTRHNPEHPLQRTGHASYVETPDGSCYVAYLSGRPITDKRRCILGRETSLAEVVWTDDGWLRLKDGGQLPPVTYESRLPETVYPPLPETTSFNAPILPPHMKTLRLPLSDMGSLTERSGWLRLYGQEAITSLNRQSLVARRLDAFRTETTVKLEFHPADFQQMAGLTVFYDTFNFFYLYLSGDGHGGRELRVLIRDNLQFRDPMMHGVPVGDASTTWLRVCTDGLTLRFSWSQDGKAFTDIGGLLDCPSLSDEAYSDIGHEGHTGTFIGMACQDLSGRRLHADFTDFTYRRLD